MSEDEIRRELVRSLGRGIDIPPWVPRSTLPILVIGPSGAGKEYVAQTISRLSGFNGYAVVNCAAHDDKLLLDALFGHKKGAYTDAVEHALGQVHLAAGIVAPAPGADKTGYKAWIRSSAQDHGLKLREGRGASGEKAWKIANEASGAPADGTLFLDEIGDLSPFAQTALLRFIEGHGFHPLGASGPPQQLRLRIIAATNQLSRLRTAAFREDLFWRIADVIIHVPDLQARDEHEVLDIALGQVRSYCAPRGVTLDAAGRRQVLEQIRSGHFSKRDSLLDSGNYRSLIAYLKRAAHAAGVARQNAEITAEDLDAASRCMEEADKALRRSVDTKKTSTGVSHETQMADLVKWFEIFQNGVVTEQLPFPPTEPPGGSLSDTAVFESSDSVRASMNLAVALHHLFNAHGFPGSEEHSDIRRWFRDPDGLLQRASAAPQPLSEVRVNNSMPLGFRTKDVWGDILFVALLRAGSKAREPSAQSIAVLFQSNGSNPRKTREFITNFLKKRAFRHADVEVLTRSEGKQGRPFRDVWEFLRSENGSEPTLRPSRDAARDEPRRKRAEGYIRFLRVVASYL